MAKDQAKNIAASVRARLLNVAKMSRRGLDIDEHNHVERLLPEHVSALLFALQTEST